MADDSKYVCEKMWNVVKEAIKGKKHWKFMEFFELMNKTMESKQVPESMSKVMEWSH